MNFLPRTRSPWRRCWPLLSTVVLGLVFVPATMASWGKGECLHSEEGHCYAVTEWRMTHEGESVKGAEYYPETTTMNVPEWENGSFVDDEMWLSFRPSLGWLEIGQTGGNGLSCCTLHPFIAHAEYYNSRGEPVGYQEYLWETVDAEPKNLYRIEDPGANGIWCQYIWNDPVFCGSHPKYWSTYSDTLEGGIEAFDSTHPENFGNQEVNYIAHSGEHRAWGSASHVNFYVSPGPQATKELCISSDPKSDYPGNADWGTGC